MSKQNKVKQQKEKNNVTMFSENTILNFNITKYYNGFTVFYNKHDIERFAKDRYKYSYINYL